jgi:hypothetical protein
MAIKMQAGSRVRSTDVEIRAHFIGGTTLYAALGSDKVPLKAMMRHCVENIININF